MSQQQGNNRINRLSTGNSIYRNSLAAPKKKRSWSAWANEDTSSVSICKGVEIDSSVYEISENRYYTLILKGLIVYLITAGGIGCYLTAMDIEFNQIIFNVVILVTAVICAALYHSWKSENLGYLVFFAIYAVIMIMFKDYINSGFYAVLNDTIDWASIYFRTDGLQYYNERISNRYAAVTVAACIIGVAENVLLNNYILRRARYMIAIFLSLSINVFAFYMQMEPDTIYIVMVMIGIVMTFVFKSGQHYQLSRRDHIFARAKKGITYTLDFKSLWQGIVIVSLFILSTVAIMGTVYNKEIYDAEQQPSEAKEYTRETFQNFIMLGIFGLIDRYPNNGGLSTGELGGVSSINLDYMTDLTLIYAPYTQSTVYIKNFEGAYYAPFDNRWYAPDDYNVAVKGAGYTGEVNSLKEAYEKGDDKAAKGYMTIINVEAPALPYQPYYCEGEKENLFMRKSRTVPFYPRVQETDVKVKKHDVDDVYLRVAEENEEVIDDFIKEAGIKNGTPREVVQQIHDYFQENVPYTIRPGATPWRTDFVNYFLTENKKGYCAHFASAATLILRRMGIPARYCEGYAVSFSQVLDNGELLEDESYSNYFDGYNELGETAPVRVNVTDADAHAWVEVLDPDYGWIQVEVTPSGGLLEEEEDDFWDNFNNLFGEGVDDAAERTSNVTNTGLSGADSFMGYLAYAVIIVLVLGALTFGGIKLFPEIKYASDYRKANLSDKLILKYSRYVRRHKRRNKGFSDKMNYSDQMDYLMPYSGSERSKIVDILERAGFSNKEILKSEFDYAMAKLAEIFKKKK